MEFFFNLSCKYLKVKILHENINFWLNKLNHWEALGQEVQRGANCSELSNRDSPLRKKQYKAVFTASAPPHSLILSPSLLLPWRHLTLLYSCYNPASLFIELYHILVQTCSTILSSNCDESLSGIVYYLVQTKLRPGHTTSQYS